MACAGEAVPDGAVLWISESVKTQRAGEGIRADGNGAQNGTEGDLAGHVPATTESRPTEMYHVRESDVLQRTETGVAVAGATGLP